MTQTMRETKRRLPMRVRGIGAVILLALSLSGCSQSGHLNIFGYSTEPVYDPGIKTIYVPIFQNVSFRRGVEFELTRAVIREIESKTPFKVVNCRERADTELAGKIVNWNKRVININQLNEVREAELGFAVELAWRDLRGIPIDPALVPLDKDGKPIPPPPILVLPTATFIPELGGSAASAEKALIDNVALRIVQQMEFAPLY